MLRSLAQAQSPLWALARAAAAASGQQQQQLFLSSAAAAAARSAGDVPAGHLNSDLSPTVCNIGLGRRRDLTLRQDLCLWRSGVKTPFTDIFKGKKVILVGFPGGPICTEKHIPGYVQMLDLLAKKGVDQVLCVTVDEPAAVQALAEKLKLTGSKVDLLADRNGGFTRLLGVELAAPDAQGEPRCQRYAAIVDDGLLLKLKVERSPGELKLTDAQSMCKLWQECYDV